MKDTYGKKYDPEEDQRRFNIYCESLKKIQEHNKKFEAGEVSWSMGVNQFADLRAEEVPRGLLPLPKKKGLAGSS